MPRCAVSDKQKPQTHQHFGYNFMLNSVFINICGQLNGSEVNATEFQSLLKGFGSIWQSSFRLKNAL